jgi:hypothetical protein
MRALQRSMFNFEKLDVWQEAIGFAAEKQSRMLGGLRR